MREGGDSQRIYLDAVILIGFYEKTDLGRHSREVIKRIGRMLREHRGAVKIPMTVLGEFLAEMMYKDVDIFKVFRALNPEIVGVNHKSIKLALELLRKDEYLETNDALAVAQAIVDEEAEWFITTDKSLLHNKVILDAIRERRSRLKISDRF